MPKLGLRAIKTAISVFLTMLFYLILYLINPDFAQTWYSPFFAGIAAVYSMQNNPTSSFRQAKIRSVGSLVGGLFGLVLILLYEGFLMGPILLHYSYSFHLAILYVIVGIMMIPLIYLLIVCKQTSIIFVAALTYLSVTISLRNNLPVTFFAFNRILSTIIGVMITLFVNSVPFKHHKNEQLLFVLSLDHLLLTKDKQLSEYTRYELNHLISQGAKITLSTTRTPASLSKILSGVHFKLPLMIMNGSCLFDPITNEYKRIKSMPYEVKDHMRQFLKEMKHNAFIYTIIDDVLSIYHNEFQNEGEKRFYDDRKNDYFRNHIRGEISIQEDVIYYILINKTDIIEEIVSKLAKSEISPSITMHHYPYDVLPGYQILKINSVHASKEIALEEFIHTYQPEKVIAMGAHEYDIHFMESADIAYTIPEAKAEVRQAADYLFDTKKPDFALRKVHKLFYTKNINEFFEKKNRKQA